MRGINKVILIGNLTRDPELKQMEGGRALCKVGLATNESYKKKDGEKVEKAEFHNLTAWGPLADVMGKYLRKGAPIYVEGKLQTRKWQDADGKDRWSTDVVVNEMQMLGKMPDRDDPSTGPPTDFDEPDKGPTDDFSDSIPF